MAGVDAASTYTYVFIREDLPATVQLVQACHAAFEMGLDLERPATPKVDNLVALGVRDTRALMRAQEHLQRSGVNHHVFHEPDPDHAPLGYTAICTEPVSVERKALFARYNLLA